MRVRRVRSIFLAFVPFATSGASGCAALSSWEGFATGADAGVTAARDAGRDAGDPSSEDAAPDASARPIAFVQAKANSVENVQASKLAVRLDQPNRAGDLIVVAVGWYDTTTTVTSVKDERGNTYTLAVGPTLLPGENAIAQSIFFAAGVVAADTNEVTVTFSMDAESPDVRVAEYSGLDPKSPLDRTAELSGDGSNAATNRVSLRSPRELLFGAGTTESGFSVAGPSYTVRIISEELNIVQDRVIDCVLPCEVIADAPLSSSGEWIMQLATFR